MRTYADDHGCFLYHTHASPRDNFITIHAHFITKPDYFMDYACENL